MSPVLNETRLFHKLFRTVVLAALVAIPTLSFAGIFDEGDYDNGEALFKANCASCHKPTAENLAAPGLAGVAERWGASEELLVTWIQNPQAAIATGDPYITGLVKQWEASYGIMNAQLVSEGDIKDIMNYVVNYVAPDNAGGGSGDACPTIHDAVEEESDNTAIWFLILGVFFLIVAFAAAGVNRSLKNAIAEREGKETTEVPTYAEAVRIWVTGNRAFVSIIGFFVVAVLVTIGYGDLMSVGVYEGYEPEQPIWFSHAIHACQNEIDCEYCHHTARESKHASIPSTNICMNCHKGIKKGSVSGTEEISKIYAAIGFNPENGSYYGVENGEEKDGFKEPQDSWTGEPVKWNKVHSLPDHVYFSHAQHVTVGGLDCRNCHGPVETYTLGRQATVEEVNAQTDIPGLIQLSKPTLTMGWCIECHNKAEIDLTSSDYYVEIHERLKGSERGNLELQRIKDDEKVTVKELGGWECSKCHY